MKPILLLCWCCCVVLFSPAQDETDSLKQLLTRTPDDTNKVHLYWKTAASIIYQDPQASRPYFKAGYELASKLHFEAGMEKCLNGCGLAFGLNAHYDSAFYYINAAVPHAHKSGNIQRLSLVYLNRADVQTNLGNLSAALNDCDTAILYARKANSIDGLGRIYSIMCGIQVTQHQYAAAEQSMDKAMSYFEASGNRQMVAMTYFDKADLYNKLNNHVAAVPLYRQAIMIADSLEDVENLSALHGGLAETYIHLKKYTEARKAADRALEFARQTGNTRQQAVVLTSISQIQTAFKDYQGAVNSSLEAHRLIIDEHDVEREKLVVDQLAVAYEGIGDYKNAFKYASLSATLNDSLLLQKFRTETANLQANFYLKEKDREIELLNRDSDLKQQRIRNQNIIIIASIVVVLLIAIGVILFINRNKLKQNVKELELRNQIAADLHDEVGSSLSSINMLSQLVAKQSDVQSQQVLIDKVARNSRDVMDRMSDVVWMIQPAESEASSLKDRMEKFGYEISHNKHIDVHVELNALDTVNLSVKQRKNVYLIFKEALNNAAKYANAEKIMVTATQVADHLTLLVKDNGTGFEEGKIRRGNGLKNMKERAKEIGGQLELSSSKDGGTKVELSFKI